MIYDIAHTTEYRFHQPVQLGLHRLSFRPRDGHDMRVLATELDIFPQPLKVELLHDVYGNSVAYVDPGQSSDVLRITSRFTVDHLGSRAFDMTTLPESSWMPPNYGMAERMALTPFLHPSHDDPGDAVRSWAQGFVSGDGAGGPREVIVRMTEAIRSGFQYQSRFEEGTQTPQETLSMGSGACRDFATLMIDALRRMGVAARFVSGYLYVPEHDGVQGGGATHGWVQVYLPDCGWFPVDPTNNLIGGSDLIRIAVARDAAEVSPVSGEWFGAANDFAGLSVDVQVNARAA